MIVKNEATSLPRCLDAAQPWVDEIIVVDTGSTDGTGDVARRYGAAVVEWPWRDDFAAARNESLRHATGDWVLVLDADEELAEGSGAALRLACEQAPGDVVGYLVKIVCPRNGDGGLVRLNWFPRLFRNSPTVRFEGVIHEQVIESLAGCGRIERSRVEVKHVGYTLSPTLMAAKAARNLALLERQINDDPTYAPGWFQLAETYVLLNRLDEGIEAYRRCLRLLEASRLTLHPEVVAVALQNMGAAQIARGDRERGVKSLKAALEVDPRLIPARVHLGTAALTEQRAVEAAEHLGEALALVETLDDHGEYAISPWFIHFLHGCAQARQEKFDAAIASFNAALAHAPEHADSLWLLALTSGQAGDWHGCLAALERLIPLGRDDFAFHAQHAAALTSLGRHVEAIDSAQRALRFDPTSAPVLALAGEGLLRIGRAQEAARVYARLAAITPDAVPPLLALAHCYENVGDQSGMMRTYERACTLAPDSPDVLFALGSACLRAGALDAGAECLAAAIELRPDRADYRLNHALCLVKRGDIDAACEALATLLGRWPDFQEAREMLALLGRLPRPADLDPRGLPTTPPYNAT
jgi:tetratricopeptide (TPR) repeat protein